MGLLTRPSSAPPTYPFAWFQIASSAIFTTLSPAFHPPAIMADLT